MKKKYIQPNIKLFALRQRSILMVSPYSPTGSEDAYWGVQQSGDEDKYNLGGGFFGGTSSGDDGNGSYGSGDGDEIW